MTEKSFISRDNSLILKGGAIVMMLVHHLFYSKESTGLFNDITVGGFPIVNSIGIFCKLCVAVFVFVSGYGLAASMREDVSAGQFYRKRFKKLYLNYWFIWLIFVPIGVFVFNRTFTDVYGTNVVLKALLNFFGLLTIFGEYGYNPTWWFYSCIIVLYLLFPLLNKKLSDNFFLILSISFILPVLAFLPVVNVVSCYLLPFVLGVIFAKMPLKYIENIKVWEIIVVMALLAVCRIPVTGLRFIIDALLCVCMALFLYRVELWKWLKTVMMELGKHSMNIFLFHTFIYYYWFRDIIYASRNPIIIVVELLGVCYLLSVVIEWCKRKIGFYKLI